MMFGVGETFAADFAAVALAAGAALGVGIVTAVGEGIIDAEFGAAANDLGLG